MADNIVSFDAFDSDAQIAGHQTGLPRIVLEGMTDVRLFRDFWFADRQDVFEFVEAAQVCSGGGCTGVADGVAQSKAQGIPAFGIVDRDILFRHKNWDLLFSLDDAAVNAAWAAASLYVTSRWEVEAYLLEPDHVPDWVTGCHRDAPAPADLAANAVRHILQESRALLSSSAYFAGAHADGKKTGDAMFCTLPAEKMLAECAVGVTLLSVDAQQAAQQVSALTGAVLARLPEEENEGLPFLLRYVDTKRLFKRLKHFLHVEEKTLFVLATQMRRSGHRPVELSSLLTEIANQLVH